MKIPKTLSWDITGICNQNCLHCYNDSGSNGTSGPSLDKVVLLLKELKSANVDAIEFGGGEPFLRRDFSVILHQASELDFSISISTNGTVLSEEDLMLLKKIKLTDIQVSLDGRQEFHDYFRGKAGLFERTTTNIGRMVNEGLDVVISTSVYGDNLGEVRSLVDLAADLGAQVYRANPIKPVGRAKDIGFLSETELRKLTHLLLGKKVEYKRKMQVVIPSASEYVLSQMVEQGELPSQQIQDSFGRCSAGITNFSIQPNGDVIPCVFLQEDVVSNIYQDCLEKSLYSIVEFGKNNYQRQNTCFNCANYNNQTFGGENGK